MPEFPSAFAVDGVYYVSSVYSDQTFHFISFFYTMRNLTQIPRDMKNGAANRTTLSAAEYSETLVPITHIRGRAMCRV